MERVQSKMTSQPEKNNFQLTDEQVKFLQEKIIGHLDLYKACEEQNIKYDKNEPRIWQELKLIFCKP